MTKQPSLRERLVAIALEWESRYGIAPPITSTLSEFDVAQILGCSEEFYCECLRGHTAVTKGFDFTWNNQKYQVKGNRPSGKPGSRVTLVSKANKDKKEGKYLWDFLIWILYDKNYDIEEAWEWDASEYGKQFDSKKTLRPEDMRKGKKLL